MKLKYILLSGFLIASFVFYLSCDEKKSNFKNVDLNKNFTNLNVRISDQTKSQMEESDKPSIKKIIKNAKSELKIKKIKKDKLGYKHVRNEQYYKGLRIYGAEVIEHYDDKGKLYKINGKYQNNININTEPGVGIDYALNIALEEHGDKEGFKIVHEPELLIYNSQLAYYYIISYKGDEIGRWVYFIDAVNGEILNAYNDVKKQAMFPDGKSARIIGYRLLGEDGSQVYLYGFLHNWISEDEGDFYLYSYDNNWAVFDIPNYGYSVRDTYNWGDSDRAAISAAKNFETIQKWVSRELGMNSFDDQGTLAQARVHIRSWLDWNNAMWDGEHFYFGDGDGIEMDPLAVLDICAHEYFHAVTQYSSDLEYNDESGALNESYSDIFGAIIEFSAQPDGRGYYPDSQAGFSDWLYSEDSCITDTYMRDLRDPKRFNQPSFYKGEYWYTGPYDFGGVHTNSGVQNFAFYLLAEGGSGINDTFEYSISGLGIEAAAEIALHANMEYLTMTSDYADSAQAWMDAAQDLGYPVSIVRSVWRAVGVLKYYDTPCDIPGQNVTCCF